MRPKGAGVVVMTKAKIKKVISGAVAVAAAAAIIGGSIAAMNARKPISVAERPAAVKTSDQPFVTEVTGKSKNFRIPAMITLESGRIVASADARYDTTLDGGGLDTVVAYSDDSMAQLGHRTLPTILAITEISFQKNHPPLLIRS